MIIKNGKGVWRMGNNDFNNKNCKRFLKPNVANKYPKEFREGHWRDEHEKKSLMKALGYFPKGAHILDLPCGAGRLTKILLTSGYRVTAVDISPIMLKIAKRNINLYRFNQKIQSEEVQFKMVDILNTGFRDNEFDGVICYRLFHHFNDTDIRKKAMAELQRISHGPVIISFFNSFSISASMRRLKYFIKGMPVKDRVSLKMGTFLSELKSQGMRPVDKIPVRWGVSPMWDVVSIP